MFAEVGGAHPGASGRCGLHLGFGNFSSGLEHFLTDHDPEPGVIAPSTLDTAVHVSEKKKTKN